MILASTRKDGRKIYFDARTGLEYKPGRERGRKAGILPPEAVRFLTPQPKRKIEVQPTAEQVSRITKNRQERRQEIRIVPEKKFSVWSWFFTWLKSLFNA